MSPILSDALYPMCLFMSVSLLSRVTAFVFFNGRYICLLLLFSNKRKSFRVFVRALCKNRQTEQKPQCHRCLSTSPLSLSLSRLSFHYLESGVGGGGEKKRPADRRSSWLPLKPWSVAWKQSKGREGAKAEDEEGKRGHLHTLPVGTPLPP